MKAVSDKNFEKAETLKKLLWDEQFANASPVGRVEMFEKARVEERLEALAAMDRLEKRLRADGSPVKLANLIRFKEIARKSHAEEDAKLDEALKLLKQRAEADRTLAILDDELGRMLAEEGIQAKGKAK
ncbi:hypothetical protein EBAPG3_009410 [Nitrosospira lacus]|uniref:Uncharacterized protein n=1 Tax=Nitrosospira lacus TaxID=1288494 RepID=A0A1W6SQ94_9PROT|nr:hypothetical protein EBAPG3_009410 [Nitrosospira lacus]